MHAIRIVLAVVLFASVSRAPDAQRGYCRQPALHGETIVFVSEGDLWRVGTDGGIASRLTTHSSEELHPAISPDGETVAFVGSYEGGPEIYTMPIDGGLPTRRTYGAERGAHVAGFAPDGRLLYASGRHATLPGLQLHALDLATGVATRLPLAEAWQGALTEDGRTLVFTRFRHSQHCKRYEGGTAEQLWRFTLSADAADEATPLCHDHPGTSRYPMIWKDRIYHVTDRDGTLNIWSMDFEGGDRRQHTRHAGWDVMEASLHAGRIVYRLGAGLRLLDIATGEDRVLAIVLRSDFDQARERWIEKPLDRMSGARLSPDGKRVVLTARGQVFVAPAKKGAVGVVTLSRKQNVRYRSARCLPKSDRVLTWSDESGEVELWSLAADGGGDRKQLTTGGDIQRRDFLPSPDGTHVVWTDKNAELWIFELAAGKLRRLDRGERPFGGLTWSADSRWLAAARSEPNGLSVVRLYDAKTGRAVTLTGDRYHSHSPAITPDGRWLYFLSDRHFTSRVASPWGAHQPAPYFEKTTGVYAVALAEAVRFPFDADAKRDDEPKKPGRDAETPEEKPEKKPEKKKKPAVPFPDGARALYRVPVPPGTYRGLIATDRALLYTEQGAPRSTLQTPSPGGRGARRGGRDLKALGLEHGAEPRTLVEGVRAVELSANGKKLLVRKGSALHVFDAKLKGSLDRRTLAKSKVDLSGWRMHLDPREEWAQIFDDAWRMHRDYFYDSNMHGVDWPRMREKYRPLVDRVGAREELNDAIGQMIAELSALHSRASGGDRRRGQEDVSNGSLGARFTADAEAGLWRIEHIYRGDPERPDRRGPLARPDLALSAGDGIVAVNGVPFAPGLAIEALLREKPGRRVRLRIRPAGDRKPFDASVEVVSLSREGDLRYDEWEWTRKQRAHSRSAGRVGYIHLRAMGSRDIGTWVREYSALVNKQGLVVDVRGNRGGNIDSWILNRLLRRAWFYWQGRTGSPTWNMHRAFRGHVVVLSDHRTASDGEAFAEGFKRLGLGKVIGTRTWGGEIWLSRGNRQIDRGVASAGEIGVYGVDGTWLIEGHGVVPDVTVDNLPHATFNGADRQLDTGIDHLLECIAIDPRPVPQPPKYPDKSSGDNRRIPLRNG